MTTPSPQSDPVRRYLAALPEPELPPALEARLDFAWRRQRRQRQLRHALVAAAALLLLTILPRWGSPPVPEPAAHGPDPTAIAAVRALDRELQAGYARGASATELATLWQARQAALAALEAKSPKRISPQRI